MSRTIKLASIVLILVVILVGFGSTFLTVRQEGIHHIDHTTNAGELTAQRLVGQTFVSPTNNLSGIGVLFATYSNRHNTHPVELHLRDSFASTSDLRVVTADPTRFGDNQVYRFTFEPIADSDGRTYFFYLISPEGEVGNAVTVDLDTRDQYHLGTAFLVSGHRELLVNAEVLARSGKQTVDVAFTTYHTVSLREAVATWGYNSARWFVGTWDERRVTYITWGTLLVPVLILVALGWWLAKEGVTRHLTPQVVTIIISVLVIIGIVFRLRYAADLPITNDEGNYLYDAWALRQGIFAGGDGYVKAPLVIAWIAVWQMLIGNTLLAGRLSSIVAAALTVVFVYWIGKQCDDKRTGLAAAALWALAGAPAVFGIYVHTQAVALLFATAGIAVFWASLRAENPRRRNLLIAGVLLGLGVASRKSVLALGLVPLVLILLETRSWRQRWRSLWYAGAGFFIIIAVLLAYAGLVYGAEGIREVIGLNSAEDGITAVDPAEADQVREYSIRGVTPFFRESLPLLCLALLGWGVALETFARRVARALLTQAPRAGWLYFWEHIFPKLTWLMPVLVFITAWQFFFEYEGEIYHRFGYMYVLWYVTAGLLAVFILWPRPSRERFEFASKPLVTGSTQPLVSVTGAFVSGRRSPVAKHDWVDKNSVMRPLLTALLLPLWVGGLYIFYTNWIKFHANYLVEFLLPVTIMAGFGLVVVMERLRDREVFGGLRSRLLATIQNIVLGIFILFLGWSFYLTNYLTATVPHTGTFDQSALWEAAAWVQAHIPANDAIFTGAAAVPYLADHHVTLDIAHPRWYAYQFTRENTPRLNTFLPPIPEMIDAYRQAQWFLLDSQTGFSFLMEYTEIEAGLARDWVQVHEVENGSNPLKFYQRVRPATEGR